MGLSKVSLSYYCSSRRKTHDCDQPVAPADQAEQQLASFIAAFTPDMSVRGDPAPARHRRPTRQCRDDQAPQDAGAATTANTRPLRARRPPTQRIPHTPRRHQRRPTQALIPAILRESRRGKPRNNGAQSTGATGVGAGLFPQASTRLRSGLSHRMLRAPEGRIFQSSARSRASPRGWGQHEAKAIHRQLDTGEADS